MDLWLREHSQQTADATKATHFHNVTKSYLNVPIDAQQTFLVDYCDTVSKGINSYLSEINNRKAVQLGFNVKFSFERQQVPSRPEFVASLIQGIDGYIQRVIGVIQSMMTHYFERTTEGCEYVSCYLRRRNEPLVWKTDTVEFAGQIIFPYARIPREYMSKFHHFTLNQLQLSDETPDEHLPISPISGIDTMLQPRNSDLLEMYGSSQDDEEPFQLYETYGFLNTDVTTTFELSKAFVPQLHDIVKQGIITPDILMQKIQDKSVDYWLPLFFSIGFHDIPLKARDVLSLSQSETPKITMTVIRDNGESLDKLERARQLLTHLKTSRVDQYWSWFDIGAALHSVDFSKEGLHLWKWITSQSDFKTEYDCEELWTSFSPTDGIDVETLEYLASLDNPEKYSVFEREKQRAALDNAIRVQEHKQVATAFKACFPHSFVCSNYDNSEWQYYDVNRWVPIDGNSMLMWYMNEKFQQKFEELQAEIAERIAKSRDLEYKNRNQSLMESINELIKKLSKHGFKESLCKELRIYYHRPRFSDMKDMNPHYTATPSGVIDLRGDQPIVRPGKPQDYITKQTRYAYPHEYHWDHPAVVKVKTYLRQVFRSVTLYNYFLRLLSSLLMSGNNNKIFPIFSGEGNNSKSMLVRLIEAAFGSYAVKLPTSLITDKRTAADAATPTLIHSRGAKVAFLEEPNPREMIQSGTVKNLTGHDTMYVRDLFQKGSKIVELDVTIVPILIANKIPVIPDCQQAIWDRTRVVYFGSKWRADAPDDPEEQFRQGVFKMNKFFDREIPKMGPALLWIAVNGYVDYIEQGLNDPSEVLEATESFRVANNFYIHFTRDCIGQVLDAEGNTDMTAFVQLDEMFNTFRKWYGDQQFRAKMPNKTEFKENVEQVWRQKADTENKWYGLRLNTQASTIQSLLAF